MAIETYEGCEIEHDGYGYTWSHPNHDGPHDDGVYHLRDYSGSHPKLKEVYGQIDELIADMAADDFEEEMQAGKFDIVRTIKEHG